MIRTVVREHLFAHEGYEEETMMKTFKRYLQVAVLTLFLSLLLTGFVSLRNTAHASEPSAPDRLYTSIRIQSGDTLWDIAVQYKWSGQSIQSYIEDVKEMNHLSSDRITAGQYLMIYYYSTEIPAQAE
jgi:cell division protein YceG involved in septum cleavage